jgi:hypothetical protein
MVVGIHVVLVDLLIVFVGRSLLGWEYLGLFLAAMLTCQASLAGIGLAIIPMRPTSRILCVALVACSLGFVCARIGVFPIPGYAGEGVLAVAVKSTLLVFVQMLVGFGGVLAVLAVRRRSVSRKTQYSLFSLLLAVTGIAVMLAVVCTLFAMLPPGTLLLDSGRQLLGTVFYGASNGLVALSVFFWLFPHGWRIKLITLPVAALAVGGILLVEFVALYATWGNAQWASLFVAICLMLTILQVLCMLLTLIPLRFCNVFGAGEPSS